jgi:type I restriction enzyme S subunit
MKRWPTKPLGEVCAINPKLVASEIPGTNTDVTFVPMAAVDELSGSIARPELREYSQVAKGYTPFRENDVLFAKITPCMQNGKAAIARGLRGGAWFRLHGISRTASDGRLASAMGVCLHSSAIVPLGC